LLFLCRNDFKAGFFFNKVFLFVRFIFSLRISLCSFWLHFQGFIHFAANSKIRSSRDLAVRQCRIKFCSEESNKPQLLSLKINTLFT
jgi:hypothetical protein